MSTDKHAADTWTRLYNGPNADIWVHKRCLKEMEDLSAKDSAKIKATMSKTYCMMENPSQISPERLNRNEGRHGCLNLMVQAFKSHQGRVYGVEGSVYGNRVFFASSASVKKTDKADQDQLKRAAERAETVLKLVPGSKI